MSAPSRIRSLYLALGILLVAAVILIPLAMVSSSHAQRQAAATRMGAAVQALRQRGAIVLTGASTASDFGADVISVDLSKSTIDAELLGTLSQFTGLERLSLVGKELRPQDWAVLGKLPQLKNLSLAGSNASDADVMQLSSALTVLSLNGTAVTDKCLSRVAEMKGLTSLDIAGTKVTPDGLRQLESLRSLKNLWIDESCISAESAESLRVMQPQRVEVAVLDGFGRETHEYLAVCKGSNIRGHNRDGYTLWEASSDWNNTLAGVVEAVVAEIPLDEPEAAKLLAMLGKEPAQDGWGPMKLTDLVPVLSSYGQPKLPESKTIISSVDEFIRDVEKGNVDRMAVRRFGPEAFTQSDVRKLLAAVQAKSRFGAGPFLLVRYGINDAEVRAELDRVLSDKQSLSRFETIFAFGFGAARPYFSPDEWTANEAADTFAFPRLLHICKDDTEHSAFRDDARMILTEIAYRRPEYAAEVVAALVDLLDEDGGWQSRRPVAAVDFAWLEKVAPEAVVATVPRLRAMLQKLDDRLAGIPASAFSIGPTNNRDPNHPSILRSQRLSILRALSTAAHPNPALAHEIAMEYLSRIEAGKPHGPFAPLLSPETREANRTVVIALLNNPAAAKAELPSLARTIRDWRTSQ